MTCPVQGQGDLGSEAFYCYSFIDKQTVNFKVRFYLRFKYLPCSDVTLPKVYRGLLSD